MKRSFYKYLLALALLTMCLPGGAETTDADWPLCPQALEVPARPQIDADAPLAAGDVHITADKADLEQDGVSVLQGNVEITRDRQQVSADTITYNKPENTADLEGNVEYWDEAVYLSGDKGHVEFDGETGRFENSRYIIKDNRARGTAGKLFHEYDSKTKLEDVDYTTCDPEDNFWKLSASEINLDHEINWGDARNVVFRIKDIPVLYTPYISFPLSDERKTGFLFPSFGNSNRNGAEIETPFYWNIAPEMDAILTPRILSDSGVMLMGQFRYLLARGEGILNAEYLPSDNDFNNEDRNLIGFTHNQLFGDTGKLFLTYNRVSDKEYFEDFGSNLSVTSTRYLERRAEASYSGNWWNLSGRVQDYQTVDRSIPVTSRPYKRLPQINFNAYSPRNNRQFNYQVKSEISYFDRGDSNGVVTDVNDGLRFDLLPSVSYPIYNASAFVEPKLGLRFTQYDLPDSGTFDSNPNRILPIVSVDSGIFLERDTTLFNTSFLQTLEPRLFYLYIPEDDQDDLPVFDTGQFDFSFDSLFRVDRFSGPDRVGDANQFTVALTSRLINQTTGRDSGYVSLGQIYFLKDRDVFLPGGKTRDEDSSPIVAEIGTVIAGDWKLRGNMQWDPNNNKTEKLVGLMQYNPAPDKVVNLGYRVRRTTDSLTSSVTVTDIEQSDFSFHWPVNQNWSAVGRWTYATADEKTIDLFGGVEYDSCCWGFRVVGRRFLTDADGDSDVGIFLQLELKGLAGLGKSTVEFLEENLPGYQSGF